MGWIQCKGFLQSRYLKSLLYTTCLQNMKHKSHALHHQNKPTKGVGWGSPLECLGSSQNLHFLSPPVLMHGGLRHRLLSVFLGLWDLRCHCCAPPQWHRTMLCTTDLRRAPPTCIMHHGTDKNVLASPTSDGHTSRSPLRTMVHNAGRWRTTQVGGAQHSPVPLRWSQRSSHKPRQTDTHRKLAPIL